MDTTSYSNNHIITPALCIAASLVLTACGGGGGAAAPVVTSPGVIALATGGFAKTFDTADDGDNALPFNGANDAKAQFLYTASEVNASGYINEIRFSRGTATAVAISCPNVTIKLGHTSLAVLGATFASNVETGQGSQVTVLDNATIDIPTGAANTWFGIALTTPFYYNGVDNLVVEVENTTACSASLWADYFTAGSNRRVTASAADAVAGVSDHNQTTGVALTIQPWMQFAFAGGDNPVTYGGAAPTSWPFNTSPIKVQTLHNATAINGSGPITAIGFQFGAASVAADYTYTVRMGHTTLTTLTSGTDFANNYNVDGVTTVANAATFSLPAGLQIGEWFWLPIPDGVFDYNGTDNLLVEVDVSAATATNSIQKTTGLVYNALLYGASGDVTSSASYSDVQHTRFRFNGGPVSVIDDGVASSSKYFPTVVDSNAGLYRAVELGTGGKITAIACRAHAATVAGDYPSFKLVIGHTLVDSMTDETDLISQTTVHTGGYSIPATLLAGDWINVPLTTPYTYDGKSNLIVWWGASAADGTGFNICKLSSDQPVRYPGHNAAAPGAAPGSAYGTISNRKADVSLIIEK